MARTYGGQVVKAARKGPRKPIKKRKSKSKTKKKFAYDNASRSDKIKAARTTEMKYIRPKAFGGRTGGGGRFASFAPPNPNLIPYKPPEDNKPQVVKTPEELQMDRFVALKGVSRAQLEITKLQNQNAKLGGTVVRLPGVKWNDHPDRDRMLQDFRTAAQQEARANTARGDREALARERKIASDAAAKARGRMRDNRQPSRTNENIQEETYPDQVQEYTDRAAAFAAEDAANKAEVTAMISRREADAARIADQEARAARTNVRPDVGQTQNVPPPSGRPDVRATPGTPQADQEMPDAVTTPQHPDTEEVDMPDVPPVFERLTPLDKQKERQLVPYGGGGTKRPPPSPEEGGSPGINPPPANRSKAMVVRR